MNLTMDNSGDGPERRLRGEWPQRVDNSVNNGSSGDERFDPNALFEVIASAESADQATAAIRKFIAEGNPDALRQAIAIYTRAARARGKGVEKVLADLNGLSDQQRGRYQMVGRLREPSELKRLVLDTVLEGFDAD